MFKPRDVFRQVPITSQRWHAATDHVITDEEGIWELDGIADNVVDRLFKSTGEADNKHDEEFSVLTRSETWKAFYLMSILRLLSERTVLYLTGTSKSTGHTNSYFV